SARASRRTPPRSAPYRRALAARGPRATERRGTRARCTRASGTRAPRSSPGSRAVSLRIVRRLTDLDRVLQDGAIAAPHAQHLRDAIRPNHDERARLDGQRAARARRFEITVAPLRRAGCVRGAGTEAEGEPAERHHVRLPEDERLSDERARA